MKISTVNYNSHVLDSINKVSDEDEQSLRLSVIQNANLIKDLFDFTSKKNKYMKFKAFQSVVLGVDKKKPICVGVNPETRELEKMRQIEKQNEKRSKMEKEEQIHFQKLQDNLKNQILKAQNQLSSNIQEGIDPGVAKKIDFDTITSPDLLKNFPVLSQNPAAYMVWNIFKAIEERKIEHLTQAS